MKTRKSRITKEVTDRSRGYEFTTRPDTELRRFAAPDRLIVDTRKFLIPFKIKVAQDPRLSCYKEIRSQWSQIRVPDLPTALLECFGLQKRRITV